MKSVITAALMLSAASFATYAVAQAPTAGEFKPAVTQEAPTYVVPPVTGEVFPGGPTVVPDGRAMASDQEVTEARRAYRAACSEYESPSFCECVTAGIAQALAPAEVRIAANTIGERINAEGDASVASMSDATPHAESSAQRIEDIEGHYAQACTQFRN